MKKIAIVGGGPTAIYSLAALLKNEIQVDITLYERTAEAGVGMPYADDDNSRMMLANIASIEIPPIFSSYLDWLKTQDPAYLARYGVEMASLHERQFLPRILLGDYFRHQFLRLVKEAKTRGFPIAVKESCEVTDLRIGAEGVHLWAQGKPVEKTVDLAIIATGHVWPDDDEATPTYFPSPWSGLIEASIPAGEIGIMGTSLSGIDAVMAVANQHGEFVENADGSLAFTLDKGSETLNIAMLSRSGILPEADFYCPLPYEPLHVVTEKAINSAIEQGSEGLLDRVFKLMVEELEVADPRWAHEIDMPGLTVDTFSHAWFADRAHHHPFHWAAANLEEVERNKRDKHTVSWRYAVLRLHEAVEPVVPHLTEPDRDRFNNGLARIFIDNYTAIPSESIRRLLALREAGIVSIHALGKDYTMAIKPRATRISGKQKSWVFDTFIDARGQKPMEIKDLPFPSLRQQLSATGDDFPDVAEDYTLLAPEEARGKIVFAALPYLMHDKPFIQGITVCAEIGECIARAVSQTASQSRRHLPFIEL
ncbi:FAD-NAD(P)-binding protein [Enterobacteriaceae bacterium RIT691]|nr:FAD-NAD(P)-binding protein [Enterobacteriaceae bacterium RIT691]